MVRRYKAIEDSEMNSRKECIKLREEVVNIENAVTEKIGELQRLDSYQIGLISFFVPMLYAFYRLFSNENCKKLLGIRTWQLTK